MFPSLPFSVSYFHFSQFSIPDTIQINQSIIGRPAPPADGAPATGVSERLMEPLGDIRERRRRSDGAGELGENQMEN